MRNGSSKQIGFIVPDVQNEFFNAVARSLAEQCSRLGYQLSLGISEDCPEREHKYVQSLRENRAEGLIIAPCGKSLPATRALLTQIPHVQVLRYDPKLGKVAVTADDIGAVADAVEHLISQGHRNIAYVGTPTTLSTGVARLQGYQMALEKKGIEFDESLTRFGPTLPDFGNQAAHDMLQSNSRISAFMVASSRQLVGVLRALKSARLRIPEDVSVIGYGDTEWFDLATPSISAVALPVKEMSDRATEILFLALADKSGQAETKRRSAESVFKPKLMVRESTGPNRKKAAN
jgi:LacI family transcriptional regulator